MISEPLLIAVTSAPLLAILMLAAVYFMGMFDSAWIDIKCPYCGQISKIECQTKELDCNLERWEKGDFVGNKSLPHLECIADCHSKECMEHEEKTIGYRSGFGRMFYVNVKLNEGIVTGEYEITDASD